MLESIKVPFEECKEELMKSEFLLLLFFGCVSLCKKISELMGM